MADPSYRLAVVVAHPDDETFGTGSVLLHAAAAGARTSVVCATRSEAGEVAPGVEVPDGGLGVLREQELRDAAEALGVAHVELLSYADSGMSGDPAPGTLCAAPVEEVVAAVGAALSRLEPDVVVTLDGGDSHRDHIAVRDAVLAATRDQPVRVYLHALPRSLLRAWVREKTGDPHAAAYTDPADPTTPELGTPDEAVTTVLDTSEHHEARLVAIARHRSQVSPFEGLSDELGRAFLTADHLVRVAPTWADGVGAPRESSLWG